MAKKVITVICTLLLTFAIFVGCSAYTSYGPVGGEIPSGAVENNGGLSVKKGDYYYVVNAYEYETASNEFPNVVRGGITRVDSNFENPVLIVPKIVTFSTTKAGIYIFGDYVYYFSPGTEKDKNGNVKYYERMFCKTKLDGTGTTDLLSIMTSTLDYTMIEVEGVPYLIYVSENELVSFNAVSGERKVLQKSVTGYACSADTVYYTRDVYTDSVTGEEVEYDSTKLNKEEITKRQYNCFAKMSPNGEEIVLLKDTIGKQATGSISFKDGMIFYSYMANVYGAKENQATDSDTLSANKALITGMSGLTEFYPVGDSGILTLGSGKIYMFDEIGSGKVDPYTLVDSASAIIGIVNESDGNYLYYIGAGKYNKYDEDEGGNVSVELGQGIFKIKISKSVVSGKGEIVAYFEVSTSVALPEIIDNNIFFFMNKNKDRIDNEDTDEEVTVREWFINYTYAYDLSGEKTEEQKLDGATLVIGNDNVLERDKPSND